MVDHEAPTILYVDDDASNLVAVQYALGDDLTIYTAASGQEALEHLARREYAILLTDQRMPGMSGIELCEHAAKLCPTTVRMILTAHADIQTAVRAVAQGHVVRYLRKPFRNDELLQTLRTGIELHGAQRQVHRLQSTLRESEPEQVRKMTRQEVIHDVANSSTAIGLSLECLEFELHGLQSPSFKSVDEALERVRVEVDRLRRLTLSLRREPLPSDRASLLVVAREVVASFQGLLRAPIHMRLIEDADPTVAMHEATLYRVVSNLALNAMQAAQREGRGNIELRVFIRGDNAVLEVRDDGVGVPPELAERIFERGFTTRAEGTGMGLPMVRELLAAVGAQIRVVSAEPGASFQVEFRPVLKS